MTLIGMVRKTRDRGHRFIAVDEDNYAASFKTKPYIVKDSGTWNDEKLTYKFLSVDCKCSNWEKSLIDVRKIKVV